MIKRKEVTAIELKENKIEFDLKKLTPLLIVNKTRGFRQISKKIFNALLQKEFKASIRSSRHKQK